MRVVGSSRVFLCGLFRLPGSFLFKILIFIQLVPTNTFSSGRATTIATHIYLRFLKPYLLPERACSDTTLMHFEKNTPALRFWIIYRSGVVYPGQSN